MTNVSDSISGLDLCQSLEKALFGDLDQLCSLVADPSDREGSRRVSVKAVIESADIDFYDVALLQYPSFARYTVNDLVVQRDASTCREAAVIEEGRLSSALLDMLANELIDLVGADSLADILLRDEQRLGGNSTRLPHFGYLFGIFDLDHYSKRLSAALTSADVSSSFS